MSNLDAIRAKLKELGEGKGKGGGFKRWKPKDEHNVRCLPLGDGEELSFQINWHYGVDAGRQMACPSTWGEDCVFCDFARALKSFKDENGRDKPKAKKDSDWEFMKKIDAGIKHYVPMVERKPDGTVDGPFLWEMSPKTLGALMKVCLNNDWNEQHTNGGGYRILTDLDQALDLSVSLQKKGEKGNTTSYDLTEVTERKRFTPIFKDTDGGVKRGEELVAKIPSESDVVKRVSSAEAEKVFAKYKGSLGGEAEAPAGGGGAGVEYADRGAEKPASGGLTVDAVVAKLEQMTK
jgi:hypothetical protein